MRFVAAPNAFKGTLGAPEAAAAIERGIHRVFPSAEVALVPVADGGDGTVAALVAAQQGRLIEGTVEGPLGEPVMAAFGLVDGGQTAVVELAAASGLALVDPAQLDPRRASTYGFGQLLDAAREQGVRRIIAGIGGSATNDGGAGMAQALGFRLLDAAGAELERGGAALARLARIDAAAVDPAWAGIAVEVASDVTNPLCGPFGATAVYGPQKGATPEMIAELDMALQNLGKVLAKDLKRDVADLPGAGAAGGAGAGLAGFLGARLVEGAPLVVEAAGLPGALEGATCVFTGEGRADRQTAFGKAPAEVARRADAAGVPVVLLAGSLGEGWSDLKNTGFTLLLPVAEGMATPADLESATASACRLIAAGQPA